MKQSKRILSLALTLLLVLLLAIPAFAEDDETVYIPTRSFFELHLTGYLSGSPETKIKGTLMNGYIYDETQEQNIYVDVQEVPETFLVAEDYVFTVKDGEADMGHNFLPEMVAPKGYMFIGWEGPNGQIYPSSVSFDYTIEQAGGTFAFVPVFGESKPHEDVTVNVGPMSAFAELMFRIQAFFERIANAIASFFSFAWLTGRA
ncbi:MAG: hypothetical protein IJL52_06560 [Clostridia bacterium]|nr:hypothetical protein [Clostridia bacterium]